VVSAALSECSSGRREI